MKKLTNAGEVVRGAIDRILTLQAEKDEVSEALKELRAEYKTREADLGVSAAALFKAAALHRKGTAEATGKMQEAIDLLRQAGLHEVAADLALA